MTANYRQPKLRHAMVSPATLKAANDKLLVEANEPSLGALLKDLQLVRGLMNDGLSLHHLKLLTDCAERSERAFHGLHV